MAIQFTNEKPKNMNRNIQMEAFQVLKDMLEKSFMIAVMNAKGEILEANEKFSQVFKYTLAELHMQYYWILNSGYHSKNSTKDILSTLQEGKQWSGEFCHRTKSGELIWLKSTIIPYLNESKRLVEYMIASVDITDQKQMEKWRHFAYHNELTNLPNRRMLNLSMDSFILRGQQKNSKLAILFLDINKLKEINDKYGHVIGDLFLKEVGHRLSGISTLKNNVFHVSGDEFIIIIIEDGLNLENDVQFVLDLFNPFFIIEDCQFQASASIGISIYPDHGTDSKMLFKYADFAMFEAKRSAENPFKIYNPSMGK